MKCFKSIFIVLTVCLFTLASTIQIPVLANESEEIVETEIQEVDDALPVESEDSQQSDSSNQLLEGDLEKVNYFYVGVPYLETPGESEFVASFGDGSENISLMKLIVEKNDGSTIEIENINRVGELYHFKRSFTEAESGVYKVTEIRYFIDNQEYKIVLSDLGIDAQFGVNEEYDGYVATYSEDGITEDLSDVEGSIVSLNSENVENAEELVEEKVKEITIEWRWEYETGTEEEIEENDKIDTQNGIDALNYTFDVIVTGTQMPLVEG